MKNARPLIPWIVFANSRFESWSSESMPKTQLTIQVPTYSKNVIAFQRSSANASNMLCMLKCTSILSNFSSHCGRVNRARSVSIQATALIVWTLVQRISMTACKTTRLQYRMIKVANIVRSRTPFFFFFNNQLNPFPNPYLLKKPSITSSHF